MMRRTYRFVANPDPRLDSHALFVINGKSRPIHTFNRKLAERRQLAIAEYPAGYLRFFGANVHSEEGAFNIVENSEDLEWRHFAEVVSDALSPLLWGSVSLESPAKPGSPAGVGKIALLSYGRDLFVAMFDVQFDGGVVMLAEAPLLTDLPVYPHAFEVEQDAAFVLGLK